MDELLQKWQVAHLAPDFHEHKITLDLLLLLDRSEVLLLTPVKGDGLRIWKGVQEERSKQAGSSGSQSEINCAENVSFCSSPSGSECERAAPSSSKRQSSEDIGTHAATKKTSQLVNLQFTEQLDVEAVLRENPSSNIVLDYYNCLQEKKARGEYDLPIILSVSQQGLIVAALVDHIRKNTNNYENHLLDIVSDKLVKLLPSEIKPTYYIPPKTESPLQTSPKGMLFYRLKNRKNFDSNLVKAGTSQQQGKAAGRSGPSQNPTLVDLLKTNVTPEMQAAQLWLQSNRSPWVKVLEKWSVTTALRFKTVFGPGSKSGKSGQKGKSNKNANKGQSSSSAENDEEEKQYVNEYIDQWDVLKHNSGYELLFADFDVLFPNSDNLFTYWSEFERITIEIAKKDVKDPTAKELLPIYEICSKDATNRRSCVIITLALMSAIRANNRKSSAQSDSKSPKVFISDTRDSYLLHTKSASKLKEDIKSRRESFTTGTDGGGRPLIVAVGKDLASIKEVYVSVANLLYSAPCAVTALDICFKSFHALHIEYPPECGHIWLLLQRTIYKMTTSWDNTADLKHSWIKCYNF